MAACNFCSKTDDRVDFMFKALLGDVHICSKCILIGCKDLEHRYKKQNQSLIGEISAKDRLSQFVEEVCK